MVADGMLTRKRYREVPPRVDYELTDRARELMPILGELARWGYEWAWGPPRSSEAVDIGAIFRLAPGLLALTQFAPGAQAQGTVEFTVEDAQEAGAASSYSFTSTADGVTVREQATEAPDAGISGNTAAWVAAFSPQHDRSGLRVSGNHALAERLLDGLAGVSAQAAATIAVA